MKQEVLSRKLKLQPVALDISVLSQRCNLVIEKSVPVLLRAVNQRRGVGYVMFLRALFSALPVERNILARIVYDPQIAQILCRTPIYLRIKVKFKIGCLARDHNLLRVPPLRARCPVSRGRQLLTRGEQAK
ncbi:hypothetical protein D3C75_862450 [compost metagenome]